LEFNNKLDFIAFSFSLFIDNILYIRNIDSLFKRTIKAACHILLTKQAIPIKVNQNSYKITK